MELTVYRLIEGRNTFFYAGLQQNYTVLEMKNQLTYIYREHTTFLIYHSDYVSIA